MPGIELIKLTIRSGTEQQRLRVVLEQGEPAYITDAKRLFIGDGILSGGNPIGPIIHNPLHLSGTKTTLGNAYRGDIVNEAGLMYQLTGIDPTVISSWAYIGSRTDNNTIGYNANNELYLKDNSITGSHFDVSAGGPGIIATTSSGLSANTDNDTISIISNAITVLDSGISENQLKMSTFSNGIKGGGGSKVQLDVDPTTFFFDGNILSLSSMPNNVVKFSSIDPSIIGAGLTYDAGVTNTIKANIAGVDNTLTIAGNLIGLSAITSSNITPLAQVHYDNYGRVTKAQSSVYTTFALSAKAGSSNFGFLSAYNGRPGQITDGSLKDVPLSVFQVLSTNPNNAAGVYISLSSAGFIGLPYSMSQDGKSCDRFAIPVFSY